MRQAHFRNALERYGATPNSVEYRRATGDVNGLPYVLEVAFAVKADAEYGRTLRVGINFSPALSQPFTTLDNALNEARCTRHDPVVVLVHLACPAIQFTDRGKSKAILPEPIADDLQRLVKSATARFAKAKRQADRNDRMDNRAMEELRNAHKVRPMTVKTAAYQNWDQRIDLESGNRLLAMETKQGKRIDITSENCRSESSQSARADSNGISDRTQRKLDRLAKDRPDLLDRVKAKELSVQAAAIEAGIVKAPDIMEVAKRAIGKMTTAQRLEIFRWIANDGESE